MVRNARVGEAALAEAAEDLARTLFASQQHRLRHTWGVVQRARTLAAVLDARDMDVLLAAAWLHDIGYSPAARMTGFHPLDGARYLRGLGWDERVCGLVAYHSGARLVADALGLSLEMAEFGDEHGLVADALTYADQTTGPLGEQMTINSRIADMLRRHGPGSINAVVHPVRGPYLRAVVDRVEQVVVGHERV